MTSVAIKSAEVFFLSFICLGAFSGNALIFLLVAKTPGLQTKGNVFILNLAAADVLVTVINMPMTIVAVISEDWILGEELCLISGFVTLVTFVASCMALSMISVNRYHAIVHWTTYRDKYTRGKCVLYVAIVWIFTIGLSIPPFFGWAKFDFDKGQSYCFAEWSASKSYTIFMISSCLFGPLIIMTYCYVKIFKFHKVTTATVRVATLQSRNNISRQTASSRSGKTLTRTIMILILVFALCWSPFAIIMILQVFFSVHVPRSLDLGSLVLGCLNSLCNVFVYNATNRKVRMAYKNFLCCKDVEDEQSQTQI